MGCGFPVCELAASSRPAMGPTRLQGSPHGRGSPGRGCPLSRSTSAAALPRSQPSEAQARGPSPAMSPLLRLRTDRNASNSGTRSPLWAVPPAAVWGCFPIPGDVSRQITGYTALPAPQRSPCGAGPAPGLAAGSPLRCCHAPRARLRHLQR